MICVLVDHARMISAELLASFDRLLPDAYLRGDHRFRHRAFGAAEVTGSSVRWSDGTGFFQAREVNRYAGGIAREFPPLPAPARSFADQMVTDRAIRSLVDGDRLAIGCHQIRIVAEDSFAGYPTPEGPHRDGFDFVAITCVDKRNVSGAATRVSPIGDDEAVILDRALEPGETVVLDDRKVKHYVSPVTPKEPGRAHRDVVVVTFSER